MEIERKWVIDKFEDIPCIELFKKSYIEQAYFVNNFTIEGRVRRRTPYIKNSNNACFPENVIVFKSGNKDLSREEIWSPINEQLADFLFKSCGVKISKWRYETEIYGGKKIEIDVFNQPQGLIIAEIEFKTEEEAYSYIPPEWFGKEVTGNKNYYNSNIIKQIVRK